MAVITLVEDRMLADGLMAGRLRQAGYEVEVFGDEVDAGSVLGRRAPDLAVLVVNELELCRDLRSQHPKLPILLISLDGQDEHRFQAFEAGADDFLVLPVNLRELEYRVRALLRRSDSQAPSVLAAGPFQLDERTGTFTVDGEAVHLTPRETDLMAVLMQRKGHLVKRSELLEQIWKSHPDGTKTLDVHLRSLRGKIGAASIVTVRGRGIRLDV
jgi:two-component system response regulator TctD